MDVLDLAWSFSKGGVARERERIKKAKARGPIRPN